MSKNIAPKRQFNYIKLLYIVGDFLFTGLLVGLTFLSQVYQTEVPIEKVWGDVIFSVAFALLMIIVLGIFKNYRILLREFGLVESMWMTLAVAIVDSIGFVAIFFLRDVVTTKMSLFLWCLVSALLLFAIPAMRAFGRLFRLFKARKKLADSIATLVIGGGDTAKIYIDETRQNSDNKNFVRCILDDDENKLGKTSGKIPVYGPISNVA